MRFKNRCWKEKDRGTNGSNFAQRGGSRIPFMNKIFLACALVPNLLTAQVAITFDPSVPVTQNSNQLPMAWSGGLNSPQFSDIDLNGDGLKDLFLFDRSGDKVITLLNNGQPGQASYTPTHAYDQVFPFDRLEQWALLRDYNGDGKEDIFSQTLGGFAAYKNTSTGADLSFVEVDTLVRSNYVPTNANLYVVQVDIPGIEDIDGDGDLDVITFSIFGSYEEFHKNMSMELYGTADSLEFEVHNRCWGFFSESIEGNTMTLDAPCGYNVPNPHMPVLTTSAANTARTSSHQAGARRGSTEGDRAHSGSTSLPIDLDGDGDKDLIIGDVMYKTLTALYNGADVDSAYMTSQDTLFPSYDTPVQLDLFPAAFYEDVDNDGMRDLIVAPNSLSLAENQHGIRYYHNTGSDAAPVFDHEEDAFLQDRMLDFGEGAYPVPFDFDGDGLMDLLVSNYGYFVPSGPFPCKVAALRNTGTATAPAFTVVDTDWMGLSTSGIGNSMYPAFGDVDGDGDDDMYIGDLNGKLHFYRNDPDGTVASMTLIQPNVPSDEGTAIDIGQFAAPQFFDVDGDGLQDLLVGERNGNVNYFHNEGSTAAPSWHLANDSVGNVVVTAWWNVTGYSVPFMYLNNDGERELLVGSESGWIHHYDGIDGNIDGTWNLVDSTWQDVREGANTSVVLHDFNNDGYKDAVIGNYRGGISYWRNEFSAGVLAADRMSGADAFTLTPNPAGNLVDIVLNIPWEKGLRVQVLNDPGQLVMERPLRDRRTSLSVEDLAPGSYLVRVGNGTQRWTRRLAVIR